MTIRPQSVITQDQEPVTATVDDDVVMLSARAAAYFGLDRVGSEIWSMIEQPRRVSDICAALLASYAVEPQTCETDVLKFLNELQDHGLIKVVGEDERP